MTHVTRSCDPAPGGSRRGRTLLTVTSALTLTLAACGGTGEDATASGTEIDASVAATAAASDDDGATEDPPGEEASSEADGAEADGAAAAATTYPLTVDSCGTDVTIEEEPARVLTIGLSAVELLHAAGAADRIVARAGEFGEPLRDELAGELGEVEVIDPADPGTEKVLGAQPDVVVGYGLFNSSEEDLAAAGVPSLVYESECSHAGTVADGGTTTFDSIAEDIERFGTVFDTRAVASEAADGLRAEVDELVASVEDDPDLETAASLYYFSDSSALGAQGGFSIATTVFDLLGMENVYGDEDAIFVDTNIETLLAADPDVIVLRHGFYGESAEDARQRLLAEPGAQDLAAVQADRIITVPAAHLAGDPQAVAGLRAVVEGLGGS